MVWIYLADTEASQSHCQNTCDQLYIAKSSDTLKVFYYHGWQAENYPKLRCGMMLPHLTDSNCQESTSSTVDFHVRTSVLQDMVKAWKESEAVLLARYSDCSMRRKLPSYSLKTCQTLELKERKQFPKNWPLEGMIVDGVVYPLVMWERPTKEKGGSYLPTPRAKEPSSTSEGYGDCLMDVIRKTTFPTPKARDYRDTGNPNELKRDSLSLATVVNYIPTPSATEDARGSSKFYDPKSAKQCDRTLTAFAYTPGCGKLNPTWVEWLMGVPSGWTELKPLVMEWFLSKSKRRSKS